MKSNVDTIASHSEMISIIQRELGEAPQDARHWFEIGRTSAIEGRWDEAVSALRGAAELSPFNPAIEIELAIALSRIGDANAARELLERLIGRFPADGGMYMILGSIHARCGRLRDAVECLSVAARLLDSPIEAIENLAMVWRRLGEPAQEVECWKRLAEIAPTHPLAAHMLSAAGCAPTPERADDRYVTCLFGRFASDFDEVLDRLDYRVPLLLRQSLERAWPSQRKHLRVLDVGCGTGLCGVELLPWAAELHGVDLSSEMIEKSRVRGVYSKLDVAEMCALLDSRPLSYDLIVAGDVLCYSGCLSRFSQSASGALVDGGRVLFSVEAGDESDDYSIRSHGRYAHASRALKRWFGSMASIEMTPQCLRKELGAPVQGWWVEARK